MNKYELEAMEKFMEDNSINHGEIQDNGDSVFFEWIDGNTTINQICEFESEFDVSLGHNGIKNGRLMNAEFYK